MSVHEPVPVAVDGGTPLPWREEAWPRLTIPAALERAIALHGEQSVAWSYPDAGVELTLGGARAAAAEWADALVAAGVLPGDVVAVALGSDPLWPVVQLAIAEAGAVMAGINTRYRSHELAQVLRNCRPRLLISEADTERSPFASLAAEALGQLDTPAIHVIADDDAAAERDAVGTAPAGTVLAADLLARGRAARAVGGIPSRPSVAPSDLALIQYTSGSTAAPKGVELTHDALLATAFQVVSAAGYTAEDVIYSALPFYHVGGSICTGPGAYVSGARMVIPRRYDALGSVRQMIAAGCTAQQGHAAMFTMQIDAARAAGLLGELRLRKGWAAAPPTVIERIASEMGVEGIVPVYGMSEFGLVAAGSLQEPVAQRASGIGWPAPGAQIRLAGEGEIEVRGRQLLRGYRGDPNATAAAFTPDGWLRTGDLARRGADGRLVFAGRVKDMIKPGGENVSAAEVEEFLRGHPLIAEVAVIGVPDERLGEVPAAVVQPVPGADLKLADVETFCHGRIASFKTPKHLLVEEQLPLLPNGKLDKRTLKERYA
ncbi:class I adenylate-forming enzyme family protein [Conexibacter sp. CPCC 206217]|uniref:class I adenylate-forming enzyme family protein n=1 Tax=Conexibacter sp. CPCC 206217 TaxID=3064574 RepID=UPI00271644D0|nr:class I adenylate-forming enzyme family protein [Conexibacter sp. CPCC 206217]MDO8211113.1 class I adenylate-forming enzyme family protein [Conexibacter sp. CPCC 206217]